MSTPRHPHHLVRGGPGETQAFLRDGSKISDHYVAQRYSQMKCDGAMGLCILPPARGLMIIVPPKPFAFEAEIEPLRIFTTLHYCERHIATEASKVFPADLLKDRMKAQIEARAKMKWPHEYTPDFDRARLHWELVGTPEYRAFLERLEEKGRVLSKQGIPLL